MITIRPVSKADAEQFWSMRLAALKNHPEAFSSDYEESLKKPLEAIAEGIQNNEDDFILGAFTEQSKLAGIVGFHREQKKKLRHKGSVWGVYVDPQYRGRDIAKTLMKELIARAGRIEGLKQINLGVNAANVSAKRVYAAIGFQVYGVEKKSLYCEGAYYDEELMVYRLADEKN
ncbi:GNAT family N-acetyltransferase [Paenibacillus mesophilus]|uniref:GNAT family N-acetyltransferase n=1 Tax=Paenibacillus mesophilus TaxID=2582849 RepID=UPI00110E1D9A|nr:GNAT family protein [Paenibacillus mesophilus]TMV50198.1 GNAT family N-acetyltransferase [Paenibacillus mesophilus]